MIKKRETWLDSLKGLGILFVVLGHCYPPQQNLTNYLYSFHIALFFVISGYLLPASPTKESFSLFFKKRFKRLMLPYFGYGFFTYIIWLFVGRNFGVNKELAIEPLKPLLGLFYGNGFDNYLVFNITIWFLPALFSTLIIYYMISLFFKKKLRLFIAVLSLLGIGFLDSKFNNFRLPWGINIGLIAVFFIYLGHNAKEVLKRIESFPSYLNLSLSLFLLSLGYVLQILNSGVSFNSHSYGNIFYFLFSATFSILGYSILTKVLLNNKLLQFLGKNSFRILFLHILSFSVISAILKYIFKIEYLTFKISPIGRITYFIGAILIVSSYSIIIDYIKSKGFKKA